MGPDVWKTMMAQLVDSGYPPDYLQAVRIVPNTMANVQAATTVIAPAAASLLARSEAAARKAGYQGKVSGQVDIVAHSMGAVSSRWYAAKIRPDRVRVWIALAGANHGTDALCPFGDEASRELCPAFATDASHQAVQISLNGTAASPLDESPYGVGIDRSGAARVPPDSARRIAYFSIRIEPDAWIKPESSGLIDGGGGVSVSLPPSVPVNETSPGNYLFTGTTDHDALPSHPALVRLVAALLGCDLGTGAKIEDDESPDPEVRVRNDRCFRSKASRIGIATA
jgi:pimeloyl-ACP methyl ester carboxylesterase